MLNEKKDFEGAVAGFESRIEKLEGQPHALVEVMEQWTSDVAQIRENKDLSATGRQKQIEELKSKRDILIAEMEASFNSSFESIDGGLEHISHAREADEVVYPDPPDDLRFSGEKQLWAQNFDLQYRIQKLEQMLSNQHQQNLLVAELPNLTTGDIVTRAELALQAEDNATLEVLARFGKAKIQKAGDVDAMARLGRILGEYEDSKIPVHTKAAVKNRARLAKARAEWRTRLNLLRQALR